MNIKTNATSIILLLLSLLYGCVSTKNSGNGWHSLFNGKDLSGWDTYLGPEHVETGGKPSAAPLGLNKDPNHVFQVVVEDGSPVLRISGQTGGGISTQSTFENYHLRLEFKWGNKMWWPKSKPIKDSGLLYHAVGPHGADFGSWMRSQEFQIQVGDCGDYWGVAGGAFDIPAKRDPKGNYVYDAHGELFTFSADSPAGRHCIKNPDAEKPVGEWNTIDLYCHGDTSVHVINSVVNMVLFHSKQVNKGKSSPLTKGKIQLQSEGAEIFFRNLEWQPIGRIPENVLK
ncbi:MAG: DUF1080 domain-containing protein [Saprospiraceae bacterium]|nr:DUF1080 domain-containing protein [Saprospiraceae bacterium]